VNETLTLVIPALSLAILVWDITLAGWIATRQQAPTLFTQLTVFCGLLIAPALLVAIATGTETGARTISGIAWLLALVTTAFALQVAYALVARLLSPLIAVPLLLYNVCVAAIAIGDFLVSLEGIAPEPLLAAVAARDAMAGIATGRAALVSPLALLVPMIAPAYPARWALSGVARALLVLFATALTSLFAVQWPRGVAALRSYDSVSTAPFMARANGAFALGLRYLPPLDGAPSARTVVADGRLLAAVRPNLVLLVLDDDGTRQSALDSLRRVLEPLRADSVKVAVALRIGLDVPPAADERRLVALERVLVTIKPDVVFPGYRDPVPSPFGSGTPSENWWRATLLYSARVIERVRPRTQMGWAAARLDAADSALYVWAVTAGSGVEVVGAVAFPSFSGLPGLDARLRAFERWHGQAVARAEGTEPGDGRVLPHWVVTAGGLPHAHGDAGQTAAIQHVLYWSLARDWIRAAVIGEPSDYDAWLGLRAANGRERGAVTALENASRQLRAARGSAGARED